MQSRRIGLVSQRIPRVSTEPRYYAPRAHRIMGIDKTGVMTVNIKKKGWTYFQKTCSAASASKKRHFIQIIRRRQ